jgi:hypothetical protein
VTTGLRAALAAAAFALASPALAGTPAAAPAAGAPAAATSATAATRGNGMVSLSLIEALSAMRLPELAGIFSFVAEADAPFALADFIARDKKAMKRYLDKLDDDRGAAHGLTEWDHAVCASLVNLYASPMAATFGVPDAKRMKQINECVLSPTLPLEAIVALRKK